MPGRGPLSSAAALDTRIYISIYVKLSYDDTRAPGRHPERQADGGLPLIGPIVIGWILDASGGMSVTGWGLAFLHVALIMVVGQVAFRLLAPRDLTGDRSPSRH